MTGRSRSRGRTAASWLLWALTGLLVVFGLAAIIGSVTSKNASGATAGVVFVFLLAAITGSGAWAVSRGGRAPADELLSPRAAGLRGGMGPGLPGVRLTAGASDALLTSLPPANYGTRYRQRHSQFPVIGAPLALCLLAGSIAGLAAAGTGGGAGLLIVVIVLAGLYGLLIVADLPNGIEISAGGFTVGALRWPSVTRWWRRVSGPLDAVRSWDVLTLEQARPVIKQRPVKSPSGQTLQYMGDLRMLGRRAVLRLVVEPGSVDARFPATVMRGYIFVPAAQAGAVWDGVILICTRRPAALAAALEQALPGRRAERAAPVSRWQ
jgi:hypothetical protein